MQPRLFYLCGVNPVALYYRTFLNIPAIATETFVTLFRLLTTCFGRDGPDAGDLGVFHMKIAVGAETCCE
jgi:hypothetical protein